jgi:superfamily I DNA/RNA helicase
MKATAVYGPPGTGKTTWMMDRVAALIKDGYDPQDIMYLSFTKAAAGEVLKRMGVRTSNTVSTIHSACYRMLELGGSSVINYSKLMKFGQTIGIPFKGNTDDQMETMEVGDMYLAMYSLARNRLTPFHQTYEESDRPGSEAEFTYFVESYNSWRESNGLIDFTDMLEQYHDEPVEHRCKVVFVDEAQDLSALQWSVIRGITGQPQVEHVFIAGDDDQAIYEWAGADPHGMVAFEEEYTGERVVLGQSYRVPATVHEVVTGISARIENRVPKEYKPRDEPGDVIWAGIFEPTHQKEGFILCRSHSIKQKAERLLIERRVPYMSEGGGLPGPFDCKAAKAIRAWKRYKDSGKLSPKDLEMMIAAATDSVRADLVGGDHKAVLREDPNKIFRIPAMFVDYFRDVDIHVQPKLTTGTIHSSKGREADQVTVITDWTGRVEAGYAMNPDQELRVWYVATSRAKKLLRLASLGEGGFDV